MVEINKKELQRLIEEWMVIYSSYKDKRTKEARVTKRTITELYTKLLMH